MSDIFCRIDGKAGRITLTRPQALNALSHEMSLAIEQALDAWAKDDTVALVLIDADGERAFCAGGDIAAIYQAGRAGNYDFGRDFWRDEYRMNAKLFEFPKPVVSLMQGFTMGGGVGIGCHGSHRVVCESSQIAMPECGIGLIPDVGGTLLLSQAPGRLGEYLGVTGARMGPTDAILAGFADYFIPFTDWPALIKTLSETGDWAAIDRAAQTGPDGILQQLLPEIEQGFGGEQMSDIRRALAATSSAFSTKTLKTLDRNAPLSMACTVEMIHRMRGSDSIRKALELEFRFTYRSMEHADILEGIRAQIIDKDRNPSWKHRQDASQIPLEVSRMLMPLGKDALNFEETAT